MRTAPSRFRGHPIADVVPGLKALGFPASEAKPVAETGEGFLVLQKREVAPNFHLLVIEAPQVPRNARPGQFVILMVKETSERTPFTLIDWDADRGTITLVVEEVGRSSREVVNLQQGDRIAHVTGPLGLPFPIEKVGTVVLGGGCYGIGGIYPIARAMKEAGNRVVCVLEASSHYLFYMEDRFQDAFDWAGTDDPTYRAMLEAIREGRRDMLADPRMDMPGGRPKRGRNDYGSFRGTKAAVKAGS